MPKTTAETLKQIQKQGLSISIISSVSPHSTGTLDSFVTKETRPKQNIMLDKIVKPPPRIQEGKNTLVQNRFLNSSVASHVTSTTPTLMPKASSDGKPINSYWSNPSTSRSEGKQTCLNLHQTTSPDSHSQNSTSFVEGKLSKVPDNRILSRPVSEPKIQTNNRNQNQSLSFEGMIPNMGSPPPMESRQLKNNISVPPQNQFTTTFKAANSQTKVIPNRLSETKKMVPIRCSLAGQKNISLERKAAVPADSTQSLVPCKESEDNSVHKVTRLSSNVAFFSEKKSMTSTKVSQVSSDAKIHQAMKYSVFSEPHQKSTLLDSSSESLDPHTTTMSARRGTNKRGQVTSTPISKKKCVSRSLNTREQQPRLQSSETCCISSDEGSPQKSKQLNIMKSLTTTGLTITPVAVASSTARTKRACRNEQVVSICPVCKQMSRNISFCDSCKSPIPIGCKQYKLTQSASAASNMPFVVTEQTTSIKKKIVYKFPGQTQNIQFQQVQDKVTFESPILPVSPRGKLRVRSRRKLAEPVVYTVSSDDEETPQISYNDVDGGQFNQMFPTESEGSKSDHSSASEMCHDESEEFDPQFPGVTDINDMMDNQEVGDEEMEYGRESLEEECDDEEEESLGEEEFDEHEDIPNEDGNDMEEDVPRIKMPEAPLKCRSIRIGSYKVHPKPNYEFLPVHVEEEAIIFEVPSLSNEQTWKRISLREQDITEMMVHFGKCLPIIFIKTTPSFGESVRNRIGMNSSRGVYFDPTSLDDKITKLTFLIDSCFPEDNRKFFRKVFPGEKKMTEIDQKKANEILVRSTPNHVNCILPAPYHRMQTLTTDSEPQPSPCPAPPVITTPVNTSTSQIVQNLNASPQLSITKVTVPVIPQPVVKLITYPPPPQTGGIPITNEDLGCLDEGEFLNDTILDFYLKYIFNEKLTQEQRDKTHIFSSYFYPRLTHSSKSDESVPKTVQVRRHNQVKTWTKNIDIFSKDFVVIPVNLNVHWFLAIICFPGLVPEVSEDDKMEADRIKEEENKVVIKEIDSNEEGSNPEDSPGMSEIQSPYQVEEPPDSDDNTSDQPESSTTPLSPESKQKINRPCICIFDSLSGPSRWRVTSYLRDYLEIEWKLKKKTNKIFNRDTMLGFSMKCPQQTNYSDCGLYVLQYVESFYETPISYFAHPMPVLTDWFSESKVSKKRQQIKDLILSIQKKQQATNSRRVQVNIAVTR